MKIKGCTRVLGIAVPLLTVVAFSAAHAQWMWKDERGRTVASDQPPPLAVPAKNILKAPKDSRGDSRPVASTASPAAQSSTGSASTANKDDGPKTYADKELEFRKRQKDAADAAKKQEDEAAQASSRKERCDTLRGNMAGLESGARIARINEKGEREYLDDAQRQAEIEKSRKAASDCT